MASLRVAAFTAALVVIFGVAQLHGRARAANDPACQIVFQEPGKPPVRTSMPVSSPGNPGKPLTYRDPETKVLFYVESDGRHLAAIGPDGKLLWVRNPFEDKGLCPYRSARPVIRSIEPYDIPADNAKRIAEDMKRRGADPSHRFIWIEFDSSQFGEVDQTTGDFLYEGRN
jgi:hypothetical protein